ncbi:hypothetical protein MNBD_IGNAVI01-1747 [hydrothermal vent metagenome]|uniref:Cytochrome b561 bacterial/Ni-hydrogenase domain-containing protein n=1 Tax=hydrothermal vent metagenome TaxID=652676 RepID=A0A3B1D0T7_9ZZZZ
MFRILSIVAFVLSFVWIFRYLKQNETSLKEISNNYFGALKNSFSDPKSLKSKNFSEKLKSLRVFIYLFTLLELFIMMFTGFVPLLFTGSDLTGILLLIHVTVAPLIAITFALLVVLFAQSNSFDENDIAVKVNENGNNKTVLKITAYLKINFWLISLLSLPAMVSIILSMFPLFGTEGQVNLLEIHRYSVLIISILVIFHIGLLSVNSKQLLKN